MLSLVQKFDDFVVGLVGQSIGSGLYGWMDDG